MTKFISYVYCVLLISVTSCVSSRSVAELDFRKSQDWDSVVIYSNDSHSEIRIKDQKRFGEIAEWLNRYPDNVFLDRKQIGTVIPPIRVTITCKGRHSVAVFNLYEFDVHSDEQNGLSSSQLQEFKDIVYGSLGSQE